MQKNICLFAFAVIAAIISLTANETSAYYICGDVNDDENVNVSDAVRIVNYVFIGGDPPDPLSVGDCNCDGTCNVSDAVSVINFVFIGGYEPCDPDMDGIPECDPDNPMIAIYPLPDSLDAHWTLMGPGGFSASGNGDDTIFALEVGDYTINWETIPGWVTPPDSIHRFVCRGGPGDYCNQSFTRFHKCYLAINRAGWIQYKRQRR